MRTVHVFRAEPTRPDKPVEPVRMLERKASSLRVPLPGGDPA